MATPMTAGMVHWAKSAAAAHPPSQESWITGATISTPMA
jgi:hypothetical protein